MKFKKKHLAYLTKDISWKRKLKVLEWNLRQHDLWGPFPLYAKIEIDQRCNLKCEMCQRTQIVDNAYLTLDQFKEIVNKLGSGLCEVHVHGYGEPMMNPHYFEMMEYLKEKGILFGLVTNGTLLDTDEKRKRLLELKPTKIRFSIDAADKETYERIRTGAKFEKVKNNFIELVKLRDKMYPNKKRNDPRVDIYCTLTTKLLYQIGPMIKLKEEWKSDYITFSDIAWNNQFGTSTFENCIRESMMDSEIDKLIEPYKQMTDVVFHLKNEPYRPCDYPKLHIYVDANGDIFSCTCVPGFEKPFGNIYETSNIKEIYQSKLYNEFREKSRLGQLDSKSCRRCLQWGIDLSKI